jgi:protein arginine N-methyltransferase 1
MYSVLSYGRMAVDAVRMDAYARAIASAVRPNSVVIDLGCGTGIMSLLALRAGARRVHGVEMDAAVWVARDLAASNGYGDKFVVHHGSSLDLVLDEPADVVVSDLRGSFPLFGQHLAALEDAKRRLLAPGGVLMPVRDRLFVAIAQTDAHRLDLERGWAGIERNGFDASAARYATLNSAYTDDTSPVRADQLVSEPKVWAELRYGEPFTRSLNATVDLAITRGGTAHAVVIWFEATIHGDIGYTNAPGHNAVYQRLVFPLLDPVRVAAGETARVTLRTDVGGDQWAWDTEIAGGSRVRQATFLGMPASAQSLIRESPTAVPSRSPSGDRAVRALEMMDGQHTLEQIADELAVSAGADVRRETILDEVKSCARRYAR